MVGDLIVDLFACLIIFFLLVNLYNVKKKTNEIKDLFEKQQHEEKLER